MKKGAGTSVTKVNNQPGDQATFFRHAAGIIAHDLRTPLASIRLSLSAIEDIYDILITSYELALAHQLPVGRIGRHKLALFKTAIARSKAQIDDSNVYIDMILNKFKHGDAACHFNALNIQAIIKKVVTRYPFKAKERDNISVDAHTDFMVFASDVCLLNILNNLLSNALTAISGISNAKITLHAKLGEEYNYVYVKDTGTGIAASALNNLFDSSYSNSTKGTGLGLAICRATMKSLGGDITVTSKLGQYTEFRLAFPKVTNQ